MPIKVLVISNYSDYHSTRPEGAIFIGLAKLGFKVYVMCHKGVGYAKDLEEAGITIVDFLPKNKFDKEEIAIIREFLINNQIDVLHAFYSAAIINGIKAVKGLSTKIVLYRGYAGHIKWYDPTQYVKYLNSRVDAIMCNSIGVEELFKRQLFFKKQKAVTINKGHDLTWYSAVEPFDIRRELSIPAETLLLVNVANNRRMKGIPYLLKAMVKLPKDVSIHLLLIGRDMDTKQNLEIIRKGNVETKVHFLGFRPNVLPIVAACDVFVLPSITGESITKSVIEAMSLAVTPVISDIRGNVELVEHGKSGLVFASKNVEAIAHCLLTLNNDREACKNMGYQAQVRIKNELNSKNAIAEVKRLYERILDRL